MFKSVALRVVGDQKLHCVSCEQRVTRVLENLKGVSQVRADASSQRIDILFDPEQLVGSALNACLDRLGYVTEPASQATQSVS